MSATWIQVLLLVCIFGSVVIFAEFAISRFTSGRTTGREINLRLKMIGQGVSRADTLNRLRRRESAIPSTLPKWLVSPAEWLERTLVTAGVTMPTGQLMLFLLTAPAVLFGLIVVGMLATGATLGLGRIIILLTFSVIVAFVLPLMVLKIRADRRRKRMEDQFPVALDVFVRGLRAGHPIAAALDLLTTEMPDPIGSQFGIVVDEVTYGAELRDALESMAERWDMDDLRMFVVSLSVQSETGGNLAEILENLSMVIRERASLMMKVRALSSEGRMTAIMLTALPLFAFTMLFIGNPSFYLGVSDDPAFVPGFLGLIALYFIGVFTIRRMIDLKV